VETSNYAALDYLYCLLLKMKLGVFNHLILPLLLHLILQIIGILKRFSDSFLFFSGKTQLTYTTSHILYVSLFPSLFLFYNSLFPLSLSLSLRLCSIGEEKTTPSEKNSQTQLRSALEYTLMYS
jgi:hypothetical protein